MNYTKNAFKFAEWFKVNCTPELEMADVEECVLAWADATETDLGDNFDNLCERIVELGIM